MPLVLGDGRHLQEEPLTSLILKGRLVKLNFNHIIGMANHTSDASLTTGANLSVKAFDEIEAAGPELPTPAKIADAMSPVLFTSEG